MSAADAVSLFTHSMLLWCAERLEYNIQLRRLTKFSVTRFVHSHLCGMCVGCVHVGLCSHNFQKNFGFVWKHFYTIKFPLFSMIMTMSCVFKFHKKSLANFLKYLNFTTLSEVRSWKLRSLICHKKYCSFLPATWQCKQRVSPAATRLRGQFIYGKINTKTHVIWFKSIEMMNLSKTVHV